MVDRKDFYWNDFPYYDKALTLVALVKIYSCAVESSFSRRALIGEICCENILEGITELCFMLQCNGVL